MTLAAFSVLPLPRSLYLWMYRLDVTSAGNVGLASVTDRWTGKVYHCGGGGCRQLYPPN